MQHRPNKTSHQPIVVNEPIKLPSNRSFGALFTVIFLLFGLALIAAHNPLRSWALVVAGVFLAATIFAPNVLAPVNSLWMKFGHLLHCIVSPIVLGLLFFLAVTPTAIVLRLMKKDILRLRLAPALASYWIDRDPPGPDPTSMRRQF